MAQSVNKFNQVKHDENETSRYEGICKFHAFTHSEP